MAVVNSVPDAFTASSQTVTFAIPAGSWASAILNVGNGTGNSGVVVPFDPTLTTEPSGTNLAFGPTVGNWSQTDAFGAGSMGDVNLAAGGNLSMVFLAEENFSVSFCNLTLTASTSGSEVVDGAPFYVSNFGASNL